MLIERAALAKRHDNQFSILVQFITVLWVIEIANSLLNHRLCNLGIFPRTAEGLIGIVLSPMLHTSALHLALNTGPIVILGLLISLNSKQLFWKTTLYITIVGGLLLWIFGRSAYHVGASGLIFGYFGFLVFKGIFNLSIGSLIVSVFTLFIYNGLFWQMLPTFSRVSWEGHLCGFIAGILAARSQSASSQHRT